MLYRSIVDFCRVGCVCYFSDHILGNGLVLPLKGRASLGLRVGSTNDGALNVRYAAVAQW